MSPFTQNNPLLKAWQVAAEKPAEEGGHLLLDMHPVAQARCFRRSVYGLKFMRQNMRSMDSKYTIHPSRGYCSPYIDVVSSVVFLERRVEVFTGVLFAASSSPAAASPQASAQVSDMSAHSSCFGKQGSIWRKAAELMLLPGPKAQQTHLQAQAWRLGLCRSASLIRPLLASTGGLG